MNEQGGRCRGCIERQLNCTPNVPFGTTTLLLRGLYLAYINSSTDDCQHRIPTMVRKRSGTPDTLCSMRQITPFMELIYVYRYYQGLFLGTGPETYLRGQRLYKKPRLTRRTSVYHAPLHLDYVHGALPVFLHV